MRLLLFTLLAVIGVTACQNASGLQRWPESPTYLRVERWSLAGGHGFACEIRGQTLSVHTLHDFSNPKRILFQRELSGTQIRRIIAVVKDGDLLKNLGRPVHPPPPPRGQEGIVLSDGELDRFCLREGKLADIRSMTVEYWNYSDASARRIFAELDKLTPAKYHFIKISGRIDSRIAGGS